MVHTGESGAQDKDFAALLGAEQGQIVKEFGWDEDADSTISEALEDAIGAAFVDEDSDELCDMVLLWWRDDDGDLCDALVDCLGDLDDDGRIWLLTPAVGSPGTVDPGVINESAQLAGLVQTSAERLGQWQGSCLVSRGARKS
ncbi:DUF3052 domain-containing protein [Corynebacterium choanae]|uniref:DUF3052 domain-containing protein n=1 Tax=Corynebacterium choanae TaxID=1862358 RepID=UPI001FEBE7AD|nr:DUF3052 domain-containing protein [Corynebacterium choanae]